MLRELNALAVKKDSSSTGQRELFRLNITEDLSLQKMEGKVTVEVVAESDIFTAGPCVFTYGEEIDPQGQGEKR